MNTLRKESCHSGTRMYWSSKVLLQYFCIHHVAHNRIHGGHGDGHPDLLPPHPRTTRPMAPALVPRVFASLVPWTCLLYTACVKQPPLGGPSAALIFNIYVYLCLSGFYLRPWACIWPCIFRLDVGFHVWCRYSFWKQVCVYSFPTISDFPRFRF